MMMKKSSFSIVFFLLPFLLNLILLPLAFCFQSFSTQIGSHAIQVQVPSQVSELRQSKGDDDDETESVNPIDLESPEERKRRMEMVRQVQKSFYGSQSGEDSAQEGNQERTTAVPVTETILKDVPLWRVQWHELPGYQNLLNCHVAHYTHMFHTILSGPKPWYFGHVYLPGGSENLDNPDYRLLDPSERDDNHNNKATYTGVLMKIADSRQLEDGRLALVVQALERFEILKATQHTPYAVATVKLIPDAELAKPFYSDAKTMAHELSDDFLNDNDAWGAACAAALEKAQQFHNFEYRPVYVGSSKMGAVAPLVNFDADVDQTTLVETKKDGIATIMEKHLLSASPISAPVKLEELDDNKVIQLEHDVWVQVDRLIKLLHQLNPNSNSEAQVTPLPTQMLGLLPRENSPNYIPWPEDFQLDQFANRLEDYAATESATVGTFSKSPFVRYDHVDNDEAKYPILRRAQRLSFVVWILLENIGFLEDATPLNRQDILELPSITERLQAAKRRLSEIIRILEDIAE